MLQVVESRKDQSSVQSAMLSKWAITLPYFKTPFLECMLLRSLDKPECLSIQRKLEKQVFLELLYDI